MDKKGDLLNKIKALPYWYHKIELPYGIVRIFRQPSPGNWEPAVRQVAEHLEAFLQK